jgi:hypothetical protein
MINFASPTRIRLRASQETAERGAGIAYVENDFAGHLRVVVASPSDSGKYKTTCNFPNRSGSVSQDFTL